jgi:hypothetical protein
MLLLMMGCGGTDCGPIGVNITPPAGGAFASASFPANTATFHATGIFANKSGCPASGAPLQVNWSINFQGGVNFRPTDSPSDTAVATCLLHVDNPFIITATTTDGKAKGTATLTCK